MDKFSPSIWLGTASKAVQPFVESAKAVDDWIWEWGNTHEPRNWVAAALEFRIKFRIKTLAYEGQRDPLHQCLSKQYSLIKSKHKS